MNEAVDMWNLMAYDYAGSWSPVTDHQSNLYGGTTNTKQAIDWYVAQGATKSKINMGV
jgi:chitinase